MQSITHPKNPDQITIEWMDYALNQAGVCRSGTINNIKVEPLGAHVKGLLSSMCRVKIQYSSDDKSLPISMVIKFPGETEESYEYGAHFNAYVREVRFYRELSQQCPIRIPKCYFSVMEERNNDYILVLEDAGKWIQGDQINGLTTGQTKFAVSAIARLHGYWWGSDDLEGFDWIPKENRDLVHSFSENWAEFREEHRPVLNERDIETGDFICENGEKIHDLSLISPRTIIHYDFRADNMMFNNKDEILVVDWQMAMRSLGAFDVAWAVCGSHHGALEKNHHLEFLDMWYEGLLDSGVKNYSRDDAWRDYRLSIIISSYIPVVAHHFLSHEGSRGIGILQAMISRIFYAVHECNALELLT